MANQKRNTYQYPPDWTAYERDNWRHITRAEADADPEMAAKRHAEAYVSKDGKYSIPKVQYQAHYSTLGSVYGARRPEERAAFRKMVGITPQTRLTANKYYLESPELDSAEQLVAYVKALHLPNVETRAVGFSVFLKAIGYASGKYIHPDDARKTTEEPEEEEEAPPPIWRTLNGYDNAYHFPSEFLTITRGRRKGFIDFSYGAQTITKLAKAIFDSRPDMYRVSWAFIDDKGDVMTLGEVFGRSTPRKRRSRGNTTPPA